MSVLTNNQTCCKHTYMIPHLTCKSVKDGVARVVEQAVVDDQIEIFLEFVETPLKKVASETSPSVQRAF